MYLLSSTMQFKLANSIFQSRSQITTITTMKITLFQINFISYSTCTLHRRWWQGLSENSHASIAKVRQAFADWIIIATNVHANKKKRTRCFFRTHLNLNWLRWFRKPTEYTHFSEHGTIFTEKSNSVIIFICLWSLVFDKYW